MVWAIQARSSTISRRSIRTKSGSSWNSYQKSSWDGFKNYESMNFREEDWSKIKTLLMSSRPKFRNCRMKSIVWMTWEILRIPSQYAVKHPTFPVNQRYFHLIVIQEDCHAAIITSQIHGIRRVYGRKVCANPRASSSSHYPREVQSLDF